MSQTQERLRYGPLNHIEQILKKEKVDLRAMKIQRWIDFFSSNPEQAKQIHNHTIELLKRYNGFPGKLSSEFQKDPDQLYTDSIQISNFLNSSGLEFPPFNNPNYDTTTKIDMSKVRKDSTKELTVEYAQEVLIASLFNVNRKAYGERLSRSLEFDQIRAVAAAVFDDNHIQMGTGQGKSSVVIPITAIVNSMTSKDQSSIVVSINSNLVKELELKTREIVASAKRMGFDTPVIAKNEVDQDTQDLNSLKKKMFKDTLDNTKTNEFSEDIKTDLYTAYWGENISSQEKKARGLFKIIHSVISESEKSLQPENMVQEENKDPFTNVRFMTKDDFVFQLSNNGKEFIESCPKVYFDEIDAPYLTGETYETTSDDIFMSPSDIMESVTRYALDRLVLKVLDPENDFEVSSGKGTVKDSALDKLHALDWRGWIDGRSKDTDLDNALNETVKIVGDHVGLHKLSRSKLRLEIKKRINEKLNRDDPTVEINGSADKLAEGYYSLNKLYINEGEKIVVRNEYFDQLLENHKFEPDDHLAMLAITNKFGIINLRSKASRSIKFPTVIARLKDKLIGFSGTLVQRSLRTGKPIPSPLANLLTDITRNKVFELEPKELKSAPPPVIVEDTNALDKVLIDQLKSGNGEPILIVSHYDINTTKKTYEKIKDQVENPDMVDILPSIPSQPEKLRGYYEMLKQKTKALADGKIKILFSTGSVGIGADITKSDGSFPDLKVGVIGLPDNESQLRQNLGRRRMKGNNFFWIVDKQSMIERTTLLDDQLTKLVKTRLTPKKAVSTINELPFGNGDKNLEFVLRLINDADVSGRQNDDNILYYDQLYDGEIRVQAEKLLRNKIKEQFFSLDVDWDKDEDAKRKLEELAELIGIPDRLYHQLTNFEVTASIQAQNPAEYITKLKTEIQSRNLVESMIDEWLNIVKEDAKFIHGHFYGDEDRKVININLFPIPIQSSFIPLNKILFYDSEFGKRDLEIGYTTTSSISAVTVPVIRNLQTGEMRWIRNINFSDVNKINTIFSYKKGNNRHLFVSI